MEIENIDWNLDLLIGFLDFFFKFKPYRYQQRFLKACLESKRVAGKWCRQSGKSTTVSVYCLFRAVTGKVTIIVVAPTQSQSSELYKKIRDMAVSNPAINRLITKDTQTEMQFDNGSRIISLPSGPEGKTIRGYTADIAIIEEAGQMKDQIVNTVVVPMLAATNGQIIKIGTPWLRNHFWKSCNSPKIYKLIEVSWEEALKEGQYSKEFIEEQKEQLTDVEFQTEYAIKFIDDAASFFPISLLKQCKYNYKLFPLI